MALARRGCGTRGDLKAAGLRGRNAGYTDEILAVLEHARKYPPQVPERQVGARQTPGESRRLKRLREWRRTEAERRSVPGLVVLPPTAMQHLARHGTDNLEAVPQLGVKRVRLYGDELTRLCS